VVRPAPEDDRVDREPQPGLARLPELIELTALPLALRRARPVAVLAVTLAAAILGDLLFVGFQIPGPAIAGGGLDEPIFVVAMYAVFAAAWALGDNLRTRRAYLAELEARAERLEREREETARRAVAEEQARIARELHDVISHNVSVMVVQAAAGGDVFATHPDRAREALGSIESTGREALVELRRLLGVVRPAPEDDRVDREPQPGLARLPELIEQVSATGLRVELAVGGEPRDLPLGVDLSAYRIVQEALTNTLKHASAENVEVTIAYQDARLELEVLDDGAGGDVGGDGRGLIGMRERVGLLGGELTAGPRAGGGFGVRAVIPLGGAT